MIRILIALDGSSAAETAIPHAVAIARTFSAQIELLTVLDGSPADTTASFDCLDWQLRKREAEIYLSRIAESLDGKNLSATWQLREGDAAREIVNHVAENDTDLLVMTRYGKGNAQLFVNGGTVHKVLTAARASVLLVDPRDRSVARHGYERILVAVDGTQRSEWASGFAAMLARANEASLHLLRVVEVPQLPEGIDMTAESGRFLMQLERSSRTQANEYLRKLCSRIDPTVEVTSSLMGANNIPATIEDVAADIGADLLVVAADDAPLWRGRHSGLVCENLICQSRRPILVLHSQAADSAAKQFRSVFLDEAATFADAM